jgi:hypothetical protein
MLMTLSSCSKTEGPGGSGAIIGKIMISHRFVNYDVGGNLIYDNTITYEAHEEDVFIIYGEDGEFHDDDVKTNFEGDFRFNYLEPGKYSIYVYEDCPFDVATGTPQANCDEIPVLFEAEIAKGGDQVDLGTITINRITDL